MTISDIVLEFATDLKTILGQNLSKIILYGSYARMDYDASSDVDIMILVTLSDEEIKKLEESRPLKAVSIWGWQDDPSLDESSYGYSMNGPYCGLFTELYAVKDSFKNVYEVLANKRI